VADKVVSVRLSSGPPDPSIDCLHDAGGLSKKGTKFTGVLRRVRLRTPAVVISEGWPSWLEVLPAFGFQDVKVWCQEPDTLSSFYSTLHDDSIFSKLNNLSHISKFRRPMLFVSGSRSFVKRIEAQFRHLRIWATISAEGSSGKWERVSKLKTFSWKRVKHLNVGGLTDGSFWVGCNSYDQLIPTLDPNYRCLKDILSPMHTGARSSPPPLDFIRRQQGEPKVLTNDGVLGHSSLLPYGKADCLVYALSVFERGNGWITRSLSSEEIAAAYDLPVRLQKHHWSGTALPFLESVPSKVLMSFRDAIQNSTEEIEDRVSSQPLSQPTICDPSKASKETKEGIEREAPAVSSTTTASGIAVQASKADDAEIDTWLWDSAMVRDFSQLESLTRQEVGEVNEALRCGFVRNWKSRMKLETLAYLRETHGFDWYSRRHQDDEIRKDANAMADVMHRVYGSDWWEWNKGSTLFFWRWHPEFKASVRDGIPIFMGYRQPTYRVPQPSPRSEDTKRKVQAKLSKVRARRYIEPGFVKSLTGYFPVPKSKFDLRMVYDASKCGLNDLVWAPNFFIPSVDSMVDLLDADSWMGDIDLGEMFLNFPLDPKVRPLVGVDLTPYFGDDDKPLWERWCRCLMGFKPSPYNACCSFLWGEEIIRGNPRDTSLPFQYERIVLNMPGEKDYNPGKPWLMKTREDGRIASDVITYVDDLRTIGASEKLCQEVTHRVASVVNYLGMQDAPRKRRPASQTPGAWAGSLVTTNSEGVYVSVFQERWDKTKAIVSKMEEVLENDHPEFSHKQLLSDRGFLIYVARTYPAMIPYLKGLHLTIEHWRDNRDEMGWPDQQAIRNKKRRSDYEILADFDEQLTLLAALADLQEGNDLLEPPQKVLPVPRLTSDVRCLLELFKEAAPAVRCVRGGTYASVVYGCGDASGAGFGSAFVANGGLDGVDQFDSSIAYRVGVWGSDSDDVSSNF
jgi:hypothetical protein